MAEHKYEKFTEKEEAVVEGIDISGVWNRMYEPRELTEYDLTYMDKVTETNCLLYTSPSPRDS